MSIFIAKLDEFKAAWVEQFAIMERPGSVRIVGGFTVAFLSRVRGGPLRAIVCGLHIELDDPDKRRAALFSAYRQLMQKHGEVDEWHGFRAKTNAYTIHGRPKGGEMIAI